MSDSVRHHVSYKAPTAQGDALTARPSLARQNTDQILSYYQSTLADDGMDYSQVGPAQSTRAARLTRQMSVASTSSSDYSEDSNPGVDFSSNGTKLSGVTRRSSIPSQGGSDRRRVAIVQMEALKEHGHKAASEDGHAGSTLRTRRGMKAHLEGLALVAPPDAAPKTYTQLTPPTSAPLTAHFSASSPVADGPREDKGHQRSVSEIAPASTAEPGGIRLVNSSSRTVDAQVQPKSFMNINEGLKPSVGEDASVLLSPTTRIATTAMSDYDKYLLSPTSPYTARSAREKPLITPEIGQGKEIHVPVAAPIVVNLSSATTLQQESPKNENPKPEVVSQHVALAPFPPQETALYLNYQPGLHATAGPLPPPPRAMFDIDHHAPPPPRPPRVHSPPPARIRGDLEAVKQALQLPPSVSAALASRIPKSTPTSVPASNTDTSSPVSGFEVPKALHHREGAFPVSSSESVAGLGSSLKQGDPLDMKEEEDRVSPELVSRKLTHDDSDIPMVTVVEPPPRTVSLPSDSESSHEGKDGWVEVARDTNPLTEGLHKPSIERTASSAKSQSFRNSLTTNLKRFSSLPRTPSLSSKSNRRSSASTQHSSRTPSPSLRQSTPIPRRKIISYSPAAMQCHEVRGCKNTAERCVIYASKINELYIYDCGLTDWLLDTKYREINGSGHRVPTTRSFSPFSPKQRHTSRSSMISEATFPMRPDASTATDLTSRSPIDVTPPTAPPPLPYPSLALSQRSYPPRSSSSIGNGTPTSSLRSLASSNAGSKSGGFFASLGRKASLSSKREKSGPLSSISAPSTAGRLTKPPPSSHNISRPLNLTNIPSAPGGPRAPPGRAQRSLTLMTTKTSPFRIPQFVRQVDKLVDLLPHVDRDILAGYLRRAGQDILAIGQYLEDEKNGTVRAP
ncbi:hypothetical protein BDQ17DRAFT_1348886 [Cyathus striatus]|nr:hypothetical protein BDQ17DRAFT_1348886 [Cyathus striatus]